MGSRNIRIRKENRMLICGRIVVSCFHLPFPSIRRTWWISGFPLRIYVVYCVFETFQSLNKVEKKKMFHKTDA